MQHSEATQVAEDKLVEAIGRFDKAIKALEFAVVADHPAAAWVRHARELVKANTEMTLAKKALSRAQSREIMERGYNV